jgi:Tfp pilus assembly protein PilV
MLTEACVSLVLVGMVLSAVSLLLTRHARATDYFLNYRRSQLAAESCVERMRAGTMAVAEGAFTDEAGVSFEIHTSTADQAWQPLIRVEVTARIVGKHGRTAHYRINAYMPLSRPAEGDGR